LLIETLKNKDEEFINKIQKYFEDHVTNYGKKVLVDHGECFPKIKKPRAK
jgi:hypothetical protein